MIVTKPVKKNKIDRIFKQIKGAIHKGMELGVATLAVKIQADAREILSEQISKTGGKESGKLSKAITVEPAESRSGYYRWDVVVDTSKAPYAYWVEFGRNAPEGLPYSKAGGRDYSKSKFKGHKFLRTAAKNYSGKEASEVEANVIQDILKKML